MYPTAKQPRRSTPGCLAARSGASIRRVRGRRAPINLDLGPCQSCTAHSSRYAGTGGQPDREPGQGGPRHHRPRRAVTLCHAHDRQDPDRPDALVRSSTRCARTSTSSRPKGLSAQGCAAHPRQQLGLGLGLGLGLAYAVPGAVCHRWRMPVPEVAYFMPRACGKMGINSTQQ